MKIVSVLTTESTGGAEFASVELLDAMVERGHEAVLLTNRVELKRDTRVTTRPIDLGPKLSQATYRPLRRRVPILARRLRSALEAELPFDVLLLHYKKEQLLALTLPADQWPLVVWAEWGPVPYPMRRGLPNRLYRRAADRADLVLAISEGTRRSVVSAGVPAEKVVVLNNAVRTDAIRFSETGRRATRARLGIPDDAFVVGCVSRFHPKKRNEVVVDAVALLGGSVHLVLAGDGETETALRKRAEKLGERVHFISTPGDEVADVYSAFDVSVFCPSPTEGAPRAVILAMLTERPVVSTAAEGVADLLSAGGLILAPENDARALASVLIQYEGDPLRRRADGAAGRELVEQTHARSVVAARLEKLVQEARARGAGAVLR